MYHYMYYCQMNNNKISPATYIMLFSVASAAGGEMEILRNIARDEADEI